MTIEHPSSPPDKFRVPPLRRSPVFRAPPPAQDGPIALLRALAAVIRAHRVALGLWVLACIVAAAFFARSLPPVYTASSTLFLQSQVQVIPSAQDAYSSVQLDLNRVDSELQVIRSERLQRQVFDGLGLATLPELQPRPPSLLRRIFGGGRRAADTADVVEVPAGPDAKSPANLSPADRKIWEEAFANFRDRFSARRVGQSYVIEISYASSDPVMAAKVANAAASAYLLQSVAFKASIASSGGEFVQARLDGLAAQVEDTAKALRAGTLPEAAVPDADARVIGAALQPLGPSAPRPKLIILMGAVLGFMSGLFVLACRAALDRRLRDGTRLERETGVPRISLLPRIGHLGWRQSDTQISDMPTGPFARAVQELRTVIDLCGHDGDHGGRVIALASWSAGAGCSTVAMNLSHLLRASGQPVTLIDADVNGAGRNLSEWYAPGWRDGMGEFVGANGVVLLAEAPARPGPSGVRERSLARRLAELRARGDVVVDLPPLGETADGMAFARLADMVVLVVGSDMTFDQVEQAAARLAQFGAPLLGAVVNQGPRHGGSHRGVAAVTFLRWPHRNGEVLFNTPVEGAGTDQA